MSKEEVTYKIPTVTKRQLRIRKIIKIINFLLPTILIIIFFKIFFLIGVVPTSSMYPLMYNDSGVIGCNIAYLKSEPARGDVIAFRKANIIMVKRIIGLPGDTINIQNGIVYINEQPIIEDYIPEDIKTEPLNGINYYKVPENSYFVLGDNRINSNDSRNWGKPFVPKKNIVSKILCTFSINPFSHGLYIRNFGDICIEETHSGATPYDPKNIVTTSAADKENNGTSKTTSESNSVSATLPVASISPESISETTTSPSDNSTGVESTQNDNSITESNISPSDSISEAETEELEQ